MSSSTPKRHNGFSAPRSKMQVATWFIIPSMILHFLVFVTPILPLYASVVCTIVFLFLCIVCSLMGFLTTIIDPIDPRLSYENTPKDLMAGTFGRCLTQIPGCRIPPMNYVAGESVPKTDCEEVNSNQVTAIKTKYCWVCEHDVADDSMHCRYCNKCVSHFDHHCQWLNTCIGERNYLFFYKTLWSISILLCTHASITLAVCIDILINGTSRQRAMEWFSANLWEVVLAFNVLSLVFDIICSILILQLLFFHMKLRAKKLTTYKFILQDNEIKRSQRKKQEARKIKRVTAITTAKQNGEQCLRIRLLCGSWAGHLHPCLDPLSPDEEVQQELDINPCPS
jgi:palmitoyltransferase ZDHHC1/11